MSRMGADALLGAFAQKAVPLLVQSGKDDLLPGIAARLELRPDALALLSGSARQMLSSFKLLTGKKASDLVFRGPVLTRTGKITADILLETGMLNAVHTILLFYKGDCPLCEDALVELANKYKWLTERNVRVITVSGDETEQAFEKKRVYHQWPDYYCDLTGMAGNNFTNYGVLGVPTMFLLDQEGIVLKKTAMVDDLLEIFNRKNTDDHTPQ